jgi:hypothetical protein
MNIRGLEKMWGTPHHTPHPIPGFVSRKLWLVPILTGSTPAKSAIGSVIEHKNERHLFRSQAANCAI